ncbi:MAG TPA: zinc-binding dehydrogenase [Ktedonobacterales bacterium]|nr:zinc-binding dehydrogenase [Ktedonobacterales bacterium]
MKAIRVGTYGGPEVLRVVEMPVPTPGEQDVVVHVAAIGMTFDDVLDRTGQTERELPYTPGFEAVGTIVAAGAQVSSRRIGERVACLAPAAYAEQLVAPQEHVVPIPQHLDGLQAVAAVRDGVLAFALTTGAHAVRTGELVLVRPASEGPGLCLLQLAKQRGARVIAVVGAPEAEAIVRRLGAEAVLVWRPAEVVAEVKRLTEGAGVDVVFDAMGNAPDETAVKWELDCLRPRGHLVLFDRAPRAVGFVNFNRLSGASLTVTSVVAADYLLEPGAFTSLAGQVLDAVASGALEFPIAGTFPIGEAARAHQLVESCAAIGKVILRP